MSSSPKESQEDAGPEFAIEVADFSFSYDQGKTPVLKNITLNIPRNQVTAFIGPAGSGKSTLLRCFNRMHETRVAAQITGGKITVLGEDIHGPNVDPVLLRRAVGIVLHPARPFPKSIFENVAYGLRVKGKINREKLSQAVEESLKGAALWDEVKDRLKEPALGLDAGQQLLLCIARTLAVKPEILLLDEPGAALDGKATEAVEALIGKLREQATVVVATQNPQQASRVSDHTAFFCQGKLIECGLTSKLFTNPSVPQTEDYISGRFG